MYGLTRGLVKLNKDLDVNIQLNSNIEEIIIDPKYKRADGIGLMILCNDSIKYYVQQIFLMQRKN